MLSRALAVGAEKSEEMDKRGIRSAAGMRIRMFRRAIEKKRDISYFKN